MILGCIPTRKDEQAAQHHLFKDDQAGFQLLHQIPQVVHHQLEEITIPPQTITVIDPEEVILPVRLVIIQVGAALAVQVIPDHPQAAVDQAPVHQAEEGAKIT